MKEFEEATELAQLRLRARNEKNWQEADRLRDQIASLGFKVLDTKDGFALETLTLPSLQSLQDIKADSIVFSNQSTVVCLVVDGWLEDTRECLEQILKHSLLPIALLDVSNDVDMNNEVTKFASTHADRLQVKIVEKNLADVGWGPAFNHLIHAVKAENVIIMDISTILDGDALSPIVNELRDDVAAVGWKGANIQSDWLSFESAVGEVDALLSYLFVVKRDVFLDHPFDSKAKFYRNADLEWSLELRSQGYKLIALADELPCHQARHHGYHDSDEEIRNRESKRNYDRLLSKFRGKTEILVKRTS